MADVFKPSASELYYGKVREGERWRKVKLYRDKQASAAKLVAL